MYKDERKNLEFSFCQTADLQALLRKIRSNAHRPGSEFSPVASAVALFEPAAGGGQLLLGGFLCSLIR